MQKMKPKPRGSAARSGAGSALVAIVDSSVDGSPRLTSARAAQLEEFIRSFLLDFNAKDAAIRIGIPEASASSWASTALKHPHALNYKQSLLDKESEKTLVTRDRIIFALWQSAHFTGWDSSHSARVAALKQLCRIKGMETVNIAATVNHTGNVMVVPAHASKEDWQRATMQKQAELKAAQRN